MVIVIGLQTKSTVHLIENYISIKSWQHKVNYMHTSHVEISLPKK